MNTEVFLSLLAKSNADHVSNQAFDNCLNDISELLLQTLHEQFYHEIKKNTVFLEELTNIIREHTGITIKADTQLFLEHYDKIFDGISKKDKLKLFAIDKQALKTFIQQTVK